MITEGRPRSLEISEMLTKLLPDEARDSLREELRTEKTKRRKPLWEGTKVVGDIISYRVYLGKEVIGSVDVEMSRRDLKGLSFEVFINGRKYQS